MNLSKATKQMLQDAAFFQSQLTSVLGRDSEAEARYCRAVIFASWSALEGWINYVCSDFSQLPERQVSLYERAFLMEKRIEISERGKPTISGQDNYQKTLKKLNFLLDRFGTYRIEPDSDLWRRLREAEKIRHALVHPKITKPEVKTDHSTSLLFLNTVRETILLIACKIYRKKLKLPI